MHSFQRLMEEATQLTRRGDLQAATDAIQRALRHGAGQDGGEAGDVIDVEVRVVPEGGPWPSLPGAGRPESPPPEPRARRAPDAPDPTHARPAPPAFVPGRHGGAHLAGRDYKLFIPSGHGDRPLPLVVMLHGCTQNPDDFAAGTRMNELAQAEGFFVLYPAQAQRANAQRCWNWFKSNHQGRERGEPQLLAGMVRAVMDRHAIDPDRVYIAGLSAGGAMAAIVAGAYPEIFAAAGVHSGLAPGAAQDVPSAFEAMKKGAQRPPRPMAVPTIVFHGDADTTVHPENGVQVIAAARPPSGASSESAPWRAPGRRDATRQVFRDASGAAVSEHWLVHGSPHAWSGGSPRGSYTDPQGPDASAEMLRFFREHPRRRDAAS